MLNPALPLTGMALAIKTLYGIGADINAFIDDHIATLKQSESPVISTTGRVLEAAKAGFGLGYVSSVAIIAVGQVLLGNPLSAVKTVATAATLTNPIAMTCAAVGAICYGWSALSDMERDAILSRLSAGLEVGVELLKALIGFVLGKIHDLASAKQLVEFKEFIKTQASRFGKTLYDVTHGIGDLVRDTVEKAGQLAEQAVEATSSASRRASGLAEDTATKVVGTANEVAKTVSNKLRGSSHGK